MTTKELFEKAAADSELAAKLQKAATPEECYAVAKEAGLTDSAEEFEKAAAEIKAASEKMDAADVDAVIGGGSTTETTAITATTITAAASAVA